MTNGGQVPHKDPLLGNFNFRRQRLNFFAFTSNNACQRVTSDHFLKHDLCHRVQHGVGANCNTLIAGKPCVNFHHKNPFYITASRLDLDLPRYRINRMEPSRIVNNHFPHPLLFITTWIEMFRYVFPLVYTSKVQPLMNENNFLH